MKYKNRPLKDWKYFGFNPIHLFGDYYLLRKYPRPSRKISHYVFAKIKEN